MKRKVEFVFPDVVSKCIHDLTALLIPDVRFILDKDDWTFLVVITYPGWAAFGSPSDEEAITKKLYPEYDRFQKEEQRRFEILDSHWDVPLTPVAP